MGIEHAVSYPQTYLLIQESHAAQNNKHLVHMSKGLWYKKEKA